MQPKIALLIAAALLAAPVAGNAATITYTLTGNTSDVSVFTSTNGGISYTSYFLAPLTNAATGLNTLPDLTLNAGDTIDGSLTLSSPLTIPASGDQGFDIYLLSGPAPGGAVLDFSDESITLYDRGAAVPTPANWLRPSSAGALIVSETELSSATDPAFTFDTVDFSETITNIFTGPPGTPPVSSVILTSLFDPSLSVVERTPASVPEPAAPWLLVSGLGGLWIFKRRRAGT